MAAPVVEIFVVFVTLLAVGEATAAFSRFGKKGRFQCPLEFGTFANPIDCRRFYICNGFVPSDTPCPTPLYFDDVKKMCVYKSKDLQCGPVAVTTQAPTTPDPDAAPGCFPPDCKLPDCFCSEDGTRIPGNLLPNETPQMVILTFSGALDLLNEKSLGYLLNEKKLNPNGCPIKVTFFVSHKYTSYYYVQKLYGEGHEIAMQTITNRKPEDFWPRASTYELAEEIIGMREILHTFTNVSREELLGVRAPYLKPAGNNFMSVIYDYGLDYDSSLAAPLSGVSIWPYTLDYHMPHKCLADNCPSRSFPGIWEFPLNTFETADGTGGSCVFLDQCEFLYDSEDIFDFLVFNFGKHYETNKAPLLLNLDVNWITEDENLTALNFFIVQVLENLQDVWFVTMQQALEWMRKPVPSHLAPSFEAWKCPRTRQPGCDTPRDCLLKMDIGQSNLHYMELCGKCPERYPWLNNIRGTIDGRGVKDLIQKTS